VTPSFNEPYTAVIFTAQRTGADPEGYDATAVEMERLAGEQPGFLGIDTARNRDGFGITVSYWRTDDDARAWKAVAEHVDAQRNGRANWYSSYELRVATVTRSYSFDREHDAP
jgi:heme-degrading monooxygenase HmoA